jgi:gluconolactonase
MIGTDGSVSVLAGEGLVQSPNDLVVTADQSIVFTDPPHWPPPDQWIARVLRWRAPGTDPWPGASTLDAEGRLELLDEADEYRNGIVLSPDDRILIVSGDGLRWLDPDGGRDWLVERLAHGRGDGMAFDRAGTVYVCTGPAVEVVDAEGAIVDRLLLPDDAYVLNCCFGGDDLRTLFVTDAAHNTLLAFEGMPTPGSPVRAWSPTFEP